MVLDDGRFPHGTKATFLSAQRLAILESLGMISNDLPDTELLERAQSIPELYSTNQRAASARTCALLQYMESRLSNSPDIYSKAFADISLILSLQVSVVDWRPSFFQHSVQTMLSSHLFLKLEI